jgi:hypothetical protein
MEFAKEQKKFLDLRRGLFLVRYDSAEDEKNPPRVLIAPNAEQSDVVEIILPPDAREAVLWSPGSSLVVRATQAARLQVFVGSTEPNGSIDARVQLIPISNNLKGVASTMPELDLSGLLIHGHIAGIGDVSVAPGEWLAGPSKPARIEGLEIKWPNKPKNLSLRYSARVGGEYPSTGRMVNSGMFAGTRGRALPLIGVTLKISGSGAVGLRLVADAIFLGSPQMRMTGSKVALSAPTGKEPLVGLRIAIEGSGQDSLLRRQLDSSDSQPKELARADSTKTVSVSAPASTPPTGRVRVFRSGTKPL